MNWPMPAGLMLPVEWLEMFVVWIAAIIAILALLLSGYNTYTLHMLRRELEARREERRESAEGPGPRREGTGAPQEGTERQSWWHRVFGG